ncbi:nickel-responsive transcriptional regulator NikR [Collinsella sp. AF08-23]|uniref:nickel-responsive transcriptional regulator NikR n=1 Tax=unclassified Collinsella TaxID=2637548 RepID=UPI000E4779FA|nr:nickel-responsive transcriptional regulator NikR [Collinsella sp. AF08-23]RHS41136.1 nickel-responsive transcriptional regulator NikR [Collinsella sp. AF08-23]
MAHEHAHIGHSHHACAESNARSYTVQPSSGSGELARFSVTVPEDLLATFDEQISRRGDVANRSEAIRDLIRASLVRETTRTPEEQVIGSLTMIYDHHTGDLARRLDEVQHDYTDEIVSTMHVHLDHHNCLEILALKGIGARVYELADRLLGLRGVSHGEFTCAATTSSLEL